MDSVEKVDDSVKIVTYVATDILELDHEAV